MTDSSRFPWLIKHTFISYSGQRSHSHAWFLSQAPIYNMGNQTLGQAQFHCTLTLNGFHEEFLTSNFVDVTVRENKEVL